MVETGPQHSAPPEPMAWVRRFLAGARPNGTMLDVACGSGRHLRLALERGMRASGVDKDLSGVADLAGHAGLELLEADLETGAPFPFVGRQFDAVVVTNYLWRPILSDIVDCVAPDGILIYSTFARGHKRKDGSDFNPDFLLGPNELLEAALPRLSVVAYMHGALEEAGQRWAVQRIAAVGREHDWAGLDAARLCKL